MTSTWGVPSGASRSGRAGARTRAVRRIALRGDTGQAIAVPAPMRPASIDTAAPRRAGPPRRSPAAGTGAIAAPVAHSCPPAARRRHAVRHGWSPPTVGANAPPDQDSSALLRHWPSLRSFFTRLAGARIGTGRALIYIKRADNSRRPGVGSTAAHTRHLRTADHYPHVCTGQYPPASPTPSPPARLRSGPLSPRTNGRGTAAWSGRPATAGVRR